MVIDSTKSVVIVISSLATQTEHFAAKELQKYIEKITGIKLSVVKDNRAFAEQKIIIGGPARNKAAGELISAEEFQSAVPGPEGFMIKSSVDCVEETFLLYVAILVIFSMAQSKKKRL